MIKAIWDLQLGPVTFDFAMYLARLDCYRQLHDPMGGIDLTIRVEGFRLSSLRDQAMAAIEKRWRLKNIILGLCDLLPSIQSLTVTDEDRGPFDFPPEYNKGRIEYYARSITTLFNQGASPAVMIAPAFATQLVAKMGPYVTLTLRTSHYFPTRNVDLNDWFRFYTYLREHGIKVIVIPDQEDAIGARAYAQFKWATFSEASMDIGLRLALYERAIMNFGSANGPVAVAFLSTAPMIQFDQLRGDTVPATMWERMNNFGVGGQFPWSLPTQRMMWVDSTYDNLVEAWKQFAPTT